jgi:hypothetical protein
LKFEGHRLDLGTRQLFRGVIDGNVAATATSSDISGILFGTFWLAEGTAPPLTQFSSHCTGVHAFEMRRR